MHKEGLQSAHVKRVSVSRISVPIRPSSRLMSARNAVKFWRTFVMSTTSNQFERRIFRSNFLKLVVAAQDYDILHSSHFPEIPGWPKWTFSSPQIFKLSSGEPKIIQLVTWYHVLFLGPWSIHFLFQNTRKVIRLSVRQVENFEPRKAVSTLGKSETHPQGNKRDLFMRKKMILTLVTTALEKTICIICTKYKHGKLTQWAW